MTEAMAEVLSVGTVRPGNRGLVLEASSRSSDLAGQFLHFLYFNRARTAQREHSKKLHMTPSEEVCL